MAPSNREVAIEYLDAEVTGDVGYFLKRVKTALKQAVTTNLEGNVLSLVVDPEAQTVTLHQDWFACEPEVFDAPTLIGLIESARMRQRSR